MDSRIHWPLLMGLVLFFLYSAIHLVDVRYNQRQLVSKIDREHKISCQLQAAFQRLSEVKDRLQSTPHLAVQTEKLLQAPTSRSFLYVYLTPQDRATVNAQVPRPSDSLVFSNTAFECSSH